MGWMDKIGESIVQGAKAAQKATEETIRNKKIADEKVSAKKRVLMDLPESALVKLCQVNNCLPSNVESDFFLRLKRKSN